MARPIMNKPVGYMPESLEKLSQPFPKSAKTKPMKSNNGRKVFGFDRLRPTSFTSFIMFYHIRHISHGRPYFNLAVRAVMLDSDKNISGIYGY